MHEARALQADLARAAIAPFGWIVNQSLATVVTTDPVLVARRAAERPYLDEVRGITTRLAVVPWVPEAPSGARGLEALVHPLEATTPGRGAREGRPRSSP